MFRLVVIIASIAFLIPSASAVTQQDRNICTRQCGGRAGGEAANSPAAVACFRKCLGVAGNSDGVGKNVRPARCSNLGRRSSALSFSAGCI